MKNKRKKRSHLIAACVILTTVVLCTVACVLYVWPYSRVTMDLSLLDLPEESRPPVLYAPDPLTRGDTAHRTYHPMNETLPKKIGNRIPVTYDELPAHLIHAFVAIEDKRFFGHEGVDPLRTLHAVYNYITHKGDASFGGSTITQQLVKNLTGKTDRTPKRKLTEIFTALDLEKKTDKNTILTTYLNVINLGNGCIGVGSAADRYFGKKVEELTLGECAVIAAITNNPTLYDPVVNPEKNTQRRVLILGEMLAQGYISEADYEEAVAMPLLLKETAKETGGMTSWYTEMVIADVLRDLRERLGYSSETALLMLTCGGLSIETAVDEEIQAILTAYYDNEEHFSVGDAGRPQSSAIIIDPNSGEILAVAGAVGRKNAYYLQNYATQTQRPAGSVIKPLSVYAPALKQGIITWGTVFDDAPIEEKNGRPWPKNADGIYRGRVTVSEAVARSLNTVATQIVGQMGTDAAMDFLKNQLHMNSLVSSDRQSAHDATLASMALGQQNGGVTVREVTAAYTVFLDGMYHAPISYRRVLDSEGHVLLENSTSGERVLTEAEASVMTRLLETVTEYGTASGMSLKEQGISVAGKTGTTQNNCDRWFVGYTPRFLCGVWTGFDYPVPLDGIEGNPCISIFDTVISTCEKVYRGARPKADFDRHPDVCPYKICPLSGEIATPECYEAMGELRPPEIGWYIEGTEPRDSCHIHFGRWLEEDSLLFPNTGTVENPQEAESEPPLSKGLDFFEKYPFLPLD